MLPALMFSATKLLPRLMGAVIMSGPVVAPTSVPLYRVCMSFGHTVAYDVSQPPTRNHAEALARLFEVRAAGGVWRRGPRAIRVRADELHDVWLDRQDPGERAVCGPLTPPPR